MHLGDRTVADVVVRMPKTLGSRTRVTEARAAFDDDHVHMLLITEDGRLLGTLVRGDLPGEAPGLAPVLPYAVLAGRTMAPGLSADEARRVLVDGGERRRAVIDDAGRLIGLLCLKRRQTGFCSEAEVAARAADRPAGDRHAGDTPAAPAGALSSR